MICSTIRRLLQLAGQFLEFFRLLFQLTFLTSPWSEDGNDDWNDQRLVGTFNLVSYKICIYNTVYLLCIYMYIHIYIYTIYIYVYIYKHISISLSLTVYYIVLYNMFVLFLEYRSMDMIHRTRPERSGLRINIQETISSPRHQLLLPIFHGFLCSGQRPPFNHHLE